MAKKDLTAKGLIVLMASGAPETHETVIAQFLEEYKGLVLAEAGATIVKLNREIAEINLASRTEIERLMSQVNSISAQLTEANDKIASGPSQTAIDLLTQERDAALNMVKEMSEQIALQSEIKDANTVIVSIEGERFKLQGGNFNVPGFGKLSLADLSKNEEALKVMRDRQSGALTKVEK